MGGSARAGNCDTAVTIWPSSLITPLGARGGRKRRHRAWVDDDAAIHPVDGSKPRIVTAPTPYGASAATTRSPLTTRGRARPDAPPSAGTSVAVAGSLPTSPVKVSGAMS